MRSDHLNKHVKTHSEGGGGAKTGNGSDSENSQTGPDNGGITKSSDK